MEKKLQDYIHYYLGCRVIGTHNDQSGSIGYLTGVTNGGNECELQFILEDGMNVEEDPQFNEIQEVKLILRPLSDMTDEEQRYNKEIDTWHSGDTIEQKKREAERTHWLLLKHFDVFNLIPAGLAIDANKLK